MTEEDRIWSLKLSTLFKTNVLCFSVVIQRDIMINCIQVNLRTCQLGVNWTLTRVQVLG